MTDTDREERIRKKAYELWEREGAAHGSHEKHWNDATALIDAENTARPKVKSVSSKAAAKSKPVAAVSPTASSAPRKPGRPPKLKS